MGSAPVKFKVPRIIKFIVTANANIRLKPFASLTWDGLKPALNQTLGNKMLRNLISRLRNKKRDEENPPQASWSVATAVLGADSLVIRFRANAAEQLGKAKYPNVVAISWEFKSLSPETQEAMSNLEDALTDAVEKQKNAYLTAIVTGPDSREWQYYSKSNDEFMRILSESLSRFPAFPVSISFFSDPDWEAYSQLVSSELSH